MTSILRCDDFFKRWCTQQGYVDSKILWDSNLLLFIQQKTKYLISYLYKTVISRSQCKQKLANLLYNSRLDQRDKTYRIILNGPAIAHLLNGPAIYYEALEPHSIHLVPKELSYARGIIDDVAGILNMRDINLTIFNLCKTYNKPKSHVYKWREM